MKIKKRLKVNTTDDSNIPIPEVEKLKSDDKKIILSNIENLYMALKDEDPKYFRKVKITLWIIAIITSCLSWNFIFMFSQPRQNSYCYESKINQLNICSIKDMCEGYEGKHTIMIYTSDPAFNLMDPNFINELGEVNKKYNTFFANLFKDFFTKYNFNRLNLYEQQMDKFLGAVIFKYKEEANLSLKYASLRSGSSIVFCLIF